MIKAPHAIKRPLRIREAKRMGKRARWTVLVIGVLLVVAGAAAAARSSTASGKDISKLTWAMGATVRGLEYTHSADSGSATVISVGCETLVRYDKNGRLQPALADSFSTPNATTYVYHVRKGVKFWDGHPLTTADVVYSLKQAASKTA